MGTAGEHIISDKPWLGC